MQNTDTFLEEDLNQAEEDVSEVIVPQIAQPSSKDRLIQQIVSNIKDQLDNLERLLLSSEEDVADMEGLVRRIRTRDSELLSPAAQSRIVEGVFDGEHMVGEDGRKYLVPPNYASKSKLIEGDFLRLTIADTGRFIFKQKGPNERQRLIGMLVLDEGQNEWYVVANGHKYKVLPASISFFKGEAGDDAVILVPRNATSRWAAVENIIKHDDSTEFSV